MARKKALRSVVVPSDFSPGAQLALERALALPLEPRAKVTVIHVLPDDIPGRLRKQAVEEAERSLDKQLGRARALALEHGLHRLKLVGDVLEGATAHQVIKRAHTVEADVIALGRHGRRPVADLFIGSTALKVARTGDVPVLLVNAPVEDGYQHPLVAVDPEHASPAALTVAASLLGERARSLRVFHAEDLSYAEFVTLADAHQQTLREEALREATAAVEALAQKAKLPLPFHAEVRAGDARALILEEMAALGTDLVAVGTHAHGVARLVLGSVAEWVATHAKCDVLVVPLPSGKSARAR